MEHLADSRLGLRCVCLQQHEPRHGISNNVVYGTSKTSKPLEYSMTVKLLTEYAFGVSISFTGGCKGSSESIHIKMPHCWKSHV